MRLDSPSLKKTHYEEVNNEQTIGVSSSEKMGKDHPMVPPLDLFQGKNRICSSSARMISMSIGSFFANLTKKILPSQNRNFENGIIVKIDKS